MESLSVASRKKNSVQMKEKRDGLGVFSRDEQKVTCFTADMKNVVFIANHHTNLVLTR